MGPGSTWRSCSAPTGSGPATATTRWNGSRSSAGPGSLLPPELVGAHVGAAHSHTTGRTQSLDFRAITALFGHQGLEWDLAAASAAELAAVRTWIDFIRRWRPLLHAGTVVRADRADPAAWVHGVVSADRSEALYAFVQLTTSALAVPEPARLPGLDPDRLYRVSPAYPAGEPETAQLRPPPWLAAGGVSLPGQVLATVGLPMPVLHPEQALLLTVGPSGDGTAASESA